MDKETHKWYRKMFGSWVFTVIIMIVMYTPEITGKSLLPMGSMTPVMLILSFPILFIFGFDTLKKGLRGLYKFYFNMDSLIALGTLVAYFTGVLTFFMPITSFTGVSGMIMTIYITGKFIETKAKGRATSEIKKLLELGAKKARVLQGKEEVMIDIKDVKIGDIIQFERFGFCRLDSIENKVYRFWFTHK